MWMTWIATEEAKQSSKSHPFSCITVISTCQSLRFNFKYANSSFFESEDMFVDGIAI